MLRQLVADAARRRPRVAVVLGEAGIGKSRLVDEVTGSLDRAVVAYGHCFPTTRGEPLAPVAEVVRELHRTLGSRFGRLDDAGTMASVAALLPDLVPDPSAVRVPSQAQLFDTVVRLLRDVGRARTLVVVVEDVHWSDATSRELLDFLARSLRDEQVVLVLTARTHDAAFDSCSELVATVGSLRHAVRLTLPRLTPEEVADQVRGLQASRDGPGGHASVTPDVDRVVEVTEGIPLLVEEVVDADLDDVALLADMLVGHRLDRLSPPAQQVVATAAVAGFEPEAGALARASGLSSAVFDGAFREAVADGLLLRRKERVRFRHALLREAAQQRVPPNAERELHQRWSAELGNHPRTRADLLAAAYHRERAGDLGGALTAYVEAARMARRISAHAEEKQLLLHAVELWPSVPDAAERSAGTTLLDLYCDATWCAHLQMADAGEVRRLGDAALAALPADAGAHDRAMVTLLWHRSRWNGDGRLSTDEVLAAVKDVTTEPPSDQAVLAMLEGSDALVRDDQLGPAEAYARRAADIADRLGRNDLVARALAATSRAQALRGDEDAIRSAERAAALADRSGDLMGRFDSLEAARFARWKAARPTLEVDERLADLLVGDRPGPLAGRWAAVQADRARALMEAGRWDEARAALDLVVGEPALGAASRVAQQVADQLAARRGDLPPLPPDSSAGSERDAADAGGLVELADVLCISGDVAACRGDLAGAREQVATAIDDRAVHDPDLLSPLLWVGARVEAEIATAEGSVARGQDAGVADRLRHLVEVTPRNNRRTRAYLAHASADLDRHAGQEDPVAWEAVVAGWRDAELPFHLSTALVRAAASWAAAGDADRALARLREAVAIAEQLGARPLVDEALAVAGRWHLRLRAGAGTHPHGLTARELEVLQLVADGASNAAIARSLVISPKTASVHVSNILAKLEVPNRAAAAAVAHREQLLPSGRTAGPSD